MIDTEYNEHFPVPGGEICAGCFKSGTNQWNLEKDVPVCTTCSVTLDIEDLPSKDKWFKVLDQLRGK
jgi:hypothetical protein